MSRDLKDSYYALEALLQANISGDLKEELFQKSTEELTQRYTTDQENNSTS